MRHDTAQQVTAQPQFAIEKRAASACYISAGSLFCFKKTRPSAGPPRCGAAPHCHSAPPLRHTTRATKTIAASAYWISARATFHHQLCTAALRPRPALALGAVARSACRRRSNSAAGSSFGSCGTSSPRNALASSAGVRRVAAVCAWPGGLRAGRQRRTGFLRGGRFRFVLRWEEQVQGSY